MEAAYIKHSYFKMASFLASTFTSLIGSVAAAAYKGWGYKHIKWTSFDEGYEAAQMTGKPIMLVVEQEACAGCRVLGVWFDTNDQMQDLTNNFVMVRTHSKEAPSGYDSGFHSGRRFFPRILFYDPSGKPIKDIIGDEKYMYSYQTEADIIEAMGAVKKMSFSNDHSRSSGATVRPGMSGKRSYRVTKAGVQLY